MEASRLSEPNILTNPVKTLISLFTQNSPNGIEFRRSLLDSETDFTIEAHSETTRG